MNENKIIFPSSENLNKEAKKILSKTKEGRGLLEKIKNQGEEGQGGKRKEEPDKEPNQKPKEIDRLSHDEVRAVLSSKPNPDNLKKIITSSAQDKQKNRDQGQPNNSKKQSNQNNTLQGIVFTTSGLPYNPNGKVEVIKPKIVSLTKQPLNNKSNKKGNRIYQPEEYTSGELIKPDSKESNKILEEQTVAKKLEWKKDLGLETVDFEQSNSKTVINQLLNYLSKRLKIDNFWKTTRDRIVFSEEKKRAQAIKTFTFDFSKKQKETINRKLIDFAIDFQSELAVNMKFNSFFYRTIFFLNKYARTKNKSEEQEKEKLIHQDLIDYLILVLQNKKESSFSYVHILAIFKSEIEKFNKKEIKQILNILNDNNDFQNDLTLLIKYYHPQVWQEFIQSEEFQNKQKELKKIPEMETEELLEKPYYYGRQCQSLLQPAYIAKSNIGIEFEFLKTGQPAVFQGDEESLKKIINRSPFSKGKLSQDLDQTECRTPDKGIPYSEKLFTQLAILGKELETNPYFISYGSLHLNMDKNGSGENAFFLFYKDDEGRMEMRHIIGPILDSRAPHLLNFNNTQEQFKIIDALYNDFKLEDIKEFLKNKGYNRADIDLKEFQENYHKIQLELLLNKAKEKNDPNLVATILSAYSKGIIPMTQLHRALAETVDSFEGTLDNIKTVDEVAKISLSVAEELAEHFKDIEGTLGNIKAVGEIVKINNIVAEELAEHFKDINDNVWEEIEQDQSISLDNKFILYYLFKKEYLIEGNPDNIKAVGEVAKIDINIAKELAKHFKDIEGTLENKHAINNIEPKFIRDILLKKLLIE
ncbi:MAG TPA: hypothetical protein ENL06_02290 [Candidatus Portnoybacteria bacterium]|nr:hypothetical protein [Candidatus Portnoybacteria bacterium]